MADEETDVPPPAKKVFIQGVSGYIGGNLAKRFKAEGFDVIGTLKAASDPKPLDVAAVVEPTPEGLAEAFLSAEMTVLDCLGDMNAAEAVLSAIGAAGQLETPKVLVGISSVMTWARTSPDADEPEKALTEAEYKKRRPHSSYKDLVSLEKLVTKSARDGLRSHVVAAGLTYGAEEDLFHPLFKAAWSCTPLPLNSLGDGSNVLPTVHIADLCSAVVKLLETESVPYILALDSPSEEAPQTLAAIVGALSAELGTGEVKEPPSREDLLLLKDYEFFQVGGTPPLKLAGAAINDLVGEWVSQGGLLASMPSVVQEYRTARGLQPLRVLVHGNEEGLKTELASALATEYKLPYLTPASALKAASEAEDELGAECKAALEAGPASDELTAKALATALSTTTCKNQGYILQGFPESLAQAALLFGGASAEAAEGEEPPPEEDPDAPKPVLAAPAEFVITLEAEAAVIEAKLRAMAEPYTSEEKLAESLAAYAANNAEDSETSILALPSLGQVDVLGPLSVVEETAVDALLVKARVYLGQPRNYGPSDEEIAAKKQLEEAEAAKLAEEEAKAAAEREAKDAAEKARREDHEARRSAEVEQQEQEMLEVRSIPLRNYLMQNVIPTLTEGLIEVCKLKPEDPVDYLADYLFKNNPVEEDE